MVVFSDIVLILGFNLINPHIYAILAAGVFCLCIAFDWTRAQHIEYTLDNAVCATVQIYLDIVNLFMRILEIIRILGIFDEEK